MNVKIKYDEQLILSKGEYSNFMNLYDGCLNNETILTSIEDKSFYEVLEEFQNNILSQGQKVVFVDCSGGLTRKARAVIYENRIPEIIQEYKNRFVKINGEWTRNSLLGYCDICGKYEELVCLSSQGKTCSRCTKNIKFV